ncbi:MAG: InlB B-repeat-containing protein [Clostridia bacterium]|nr:InlB B-repeat-containing protein [Clostridia bacterium]
MSKNKFLKKLLIAGLCALTATAMVGATACDKSGDDGDDDPNPPIVTTDEYTISFNLDGGSWGKDDGYTVKVEKDGTLPADFEEPAKDGHTFAGWYNGSTLIIRGVTTITSDMTLTAHWNEVIEEEKTNSWYPESVGEGAASSETFEANSTIADTDYFEIKTALSAKYDIGTKDKAPYHQFAYTINGNKIDQAVRLIDDIAKEDADGATKQVKSVYTVTAKETCVISLYLNFVNASHNSDRGGAQIYYGLNGNNGNIALYKTSIARANYVTISLVVAKGETLTLGVNNESGNTGVLWLYGAKAEEVAENSVSVNYYDGETLLATQNVESGKKPEAPNVVIFEAGKQFDGWYTAIEDGNEYGFEAVTEDVDLYAVYYAPTTYVEGNYVYTIDSSKALVCTASEDATADGNKLFVSDSSKYEAGYIKFDGTNTVKLTLYVEAGSTVTLKITGQSGSNNKNEAGATLSWNASSIIVTANAVDSENVITAGSDNPTGNEVTVGGSDTEENKITTGTVTFTVSKSGTITLELSRGVSKTARLTELALTVAKAE